jgi:hypothetical protein
VEIINIDESLLDQTNYTRNGWGPKHKKLYNNMVFRLSKVSIIAACSSRNRVWLTVNQGNNNGQTFLSFLLRMVLLLQREDAHWRKHTRFLLDNATTDPTMCLM